MEIIDENIENSDVSMDTLYTTNVSLKERVRKVDALGRSRATGRRKGTAVAVAWLKHGGGKIQVNSKDIKEYFPSDAHQKDIYMPFDICGFTFDVSARVSGGGKSGQAGALRLAISKALLNFNPELYRDLRDNKLLTYDKRVVERKKPGLKKARAGMPTSRR